MWKEGVHRLNFIHPDFFGGGGVYSRGATSKRSTFNQLFVCLLKCLSQKSSNETKGINILPFQH